jgi:uncharacterized protein (DUF362 family)
LIIKKKLDNIVEAAYVVTGELLSGSVPSIPVIIKPNLVKPAPPPVTTDVRVLEGVIAALKEKGVKDITIAEGSGTGDTLDNYRKLGYTNLGVELVDLDREKTITLSVDNYRVWNEIVVPEILLDKFIISVPVLKEHSMCGVTVSLKNMVGILPEAHYSGYWTYKKSQIHKYDTHGCIADIISVIKPDLSIVDATVGLKGHHLSGTPVEPPIGFVYGSSDPLESDIFGCELLGRNWQDIRYLKMIQDSLK